MQYIIAEETKGVLNMREYVTPRMTGETFAANEYIAACYTLACRRGSDSDLPYGYRWKHDEFGGGTTHSPIGTSGTCGDEIANRILTNDNGEIIEIAEHNAQQGWLPAGLDEWIDLNDDNICNGGDVIYWHTLSQSGDRRWNHWGFAQATDSSHPNHS